MPNDNFTVIAFLIGSGLVVIQMIIAQTDWKHKALIRGGIVVGLSLILSGITWPWLKGWLPRIAGIISDIATHPASWFSIIILLLSVHLVFRRIGGRESIFDNLSLRIWGKTEIAANGRPMAGPTPLRISLRDFIDFEATKAGWQRQIADDKNDFITLIRHLRQAGIDGEISFWGKPYHWNSLVMEDTPLTPICKNYWYDHEIDVTTAIHMDVNAKICSKRQHDADRHVDEQRFDLHLVRSEALAWLKTPQGQP